MDLTIENYIVLPETEVLPEDAGEDSAGLFETLTEADRRAFASRLREKLEKFSGFCHPEDRTAR